MKCIFLFNYSEHSSVILEFTGILNTALFGFIRVAIFLEHMNKYMYCNKNFVAHVMLTNHKKVKSRSHRTQRVKLSGLLYLFNELIRAGI